MIILESIYVRTEVPRGKENLRKNYGLSKDEIDKYLRKSLQESCREIRTYARNVHEYEGNSARQQREGHLGLTRAIRFRTDKDLLHGEVYIDDKIAPYGTYQVNGYSDIHKRVSFFSDRLGRYITLMKVKGIKGDNFLKNAYDAKRARVVQLFRLGLRRFIDGRA